MSAARSPVVVPPQGARARRPRAIRQSVDLADLLYAQLRVLGLPLPEREYRFDPERAWRLDLAYQSIQLAVECEGLTRDGGRHQRLEGYTEDCVKYSVASLLGHTLIRVSTGQVKSGVALLLVEAALLFKGAKLSGGEDYLQVLARIPRPRRTKGERGS